MQDDQATGTQIEVPIDNEQDIVIARRTARDIASECGFGLANQTRLATVVSELTRNVIKYGDVGTCTIIHESDPKIDTIRVIVEDQGPGIDDIDLAMSDGYSTGGSIGAGLPGSKRLAHDFDIESRPGLTRVTIVMRQAKKSDGEPTAARVTPGPGHGRIE